MFLCFGESSVIERCVVKQVDLLAHSEDKESHETASGMGLVCEVYYRRLNGGRATTERVRTGHSLLKENAIVMSSCGSQPAWMEISRANGAIPGSRSLHLCDGCLLENEGVMCRPHPDAASMLTP
jgi:hypothetical protein